ncbi:hypothetical protein N7448_001879 [Penicillium atrosanguineum]|uniref:uncharacterized protein n=1 Tax=Penicillium atrosanguineum TaxID=1132637 RepID=UPI00239876C7|nr:uncharacterized protein N7443_005277 [Penicillium atrosanguineum]KAJ5150301.1 hypothetical protein N7448_001879 [Penicillium atrosanguineum]KAJ5305617.1 hypothetical protein N7443_005277 [Penicillium atrosanguineum]
MLLQVILVVTLWQSGFLLISSGSSSVTIFSQSDADNLSDCDTFDGSITISSAVTGEITISNVEEVNGAITAEGVTGLTKLIAPDLDTVKGALTLNGLDSLTALTMNALSKVSSELSIAKNSRLKTVHFEGLEEVEGQLILTGSFKSVSLPSLDQVKGRTIIRGGSCMSCSTFDSLKSDEVFKGEYLCSTGSPGNSLSAGAKGGIAVGIIVAVLLILLLLWYMIWQRRQRKSRRSGADSSPSLAVTSEKPFSSQYKSVASDIPPSVSHMSPPSSLSPPPLASARVQRKSIGPSPAVLDGRSIHEAPHTVTPVQEYHELDAGPVFSTHQRPINTEGRVHG